MKKKLLAVTMGLILIVSLVFSMTACELIDSIAGKATTYTFAKISIESPNLSATYDGNEISDESFGENFSYEDTILALALAFSYMIHCETVIVIEKDELTYKNTYYEEYLTSPYSNVKVTSKFAKNKDVLVFTGDDAEQLDEMGIFKLDDGNLLLIKSADYEGGEFTLTVIFTKS